MLYYFNVHDDDLTIDPEGIELADDRAAMGRAAFEARALAAETVALGHFTRHHRIEITDEARHVIGSMRFDEAVQIRD